MLRSKSPDGVRQEVYGLFCTHYAIRALITEVAEGRGVDPDRVSFTRSLHATRRSVRSGIGTSARDLNEALRAATAEIAHELLPERRRRTAARVVKRKMSGYGAKRPGERSTRLPGPPAITVVGTSS